MIIDVFSDYLCPWCFIGERRLRRVLRTIDAPPTVRFRAFQLRPELPLEGVDRGQLLRSRYGADADPGRVPARVAEAAAEEGLELDYARMGRIPNTLLAHGLMAEAQRQWAAEPKPTEIRWELADQLFQGYFQQGLDLAQPAVLRQLGQRAGLPTAIIDAALDGAGAAQVAEDLAEAAEREVIGVPNLWFAGRFSLPGVQGADTLKHFVERARTRLS